MCLRFSACGELLAPSKSFSAASLAAEVKLCIVKEFFSSLLDKIR
jgi:hypothetical protein